MSKLRRHLVSKLLLHAHINTRRVGPLSRCAMYTRPTNLEGTGALRHRPPSSIAAGPCGRREKATAIVPIHPSRALHAHSHQSMTAAKTTLAHGCISTTSATPNHPYLCRSPHRTQESWRRWPRVVPSANPLSRSTSGKMPQRN